MGPVEKLASTALTIGERSSIKPKSEKEKVKVRPVDWPFEFRFSGLGDKRSPHQGALHGPLSEEFNSAGAESKSRPWRNKAQTSAPMAVPPF